MGVDRELRSGQGGASGPSFDPKLEVSPSRPTARQAHKVRWKEPAEAMKGDDARAVWHLVEACACRGNPSLMLDLAGRDHRVNALALLEKQLSKRVVQVDATV